MKKIILHIGMVILLILLTGCSNKAPAEIPTSKSDQGITLEDCLKYGDYQYVEIEDSFICELKENGLTDFELYDSSELSNEILENRDGTTIIERCIGIVTDKESGDGKVLNAYDKDHYYISYRSVTSQSFTDETVFVSYMIYNPNSNYIDDIVDRYDFVLCEGQEI